MAMHDLAHLTGQNSLRIPLLGLLPMSLHNASDVFQIKKREVLQIPADSILCLNAHDKPKIPSLFTPAFPLGRVAK